VQVYQKLKHHDSEKNITRLLHEIGVFFIDNEDHALKDKDYRAED
jgi:hypothetical protein